MHAVNRAWAAALLCVPLCGTAQTMICAADLDGDGAADQASEQAACLSLGGGYHCPLQSAACTVSATSVPTQLGAAEVLILDDDGVMPSVYALPAAGLESAGVLRMTIRLFPASASTVSAGFVVNGGSATAGIDFQPITGSVSFAPGETARVVSISLTDDAVSEGPESLQLSVLGVVNADVGDANAVGTIVDDEGPLSVWVEPGVATESGEIATVAVHLTAAAPSDTEISYATSTATALEGVDYSASSGRLIIPAGASSQTLAVAALDDLDIEGVEFLWISVSGAGTTATCPLDPARPCVDDGAGGSVCSLQACFSAGSVVATITDPPDVLPDDSGPRGADGECLGQLQIFAGKPSRCRRAGVQTSFSNCCRARGDTIQDTMGSAGSTMQQGAVIAAIAGAAGAASTGGLAAANSYLAGAFDPTTLALAAALTVLTEMLLEGCDKRDMESALLKDSGYCVALGTYCAESWPLVGCVQRAESYCCFNSMLARIIQQQGRPQLPSMGGFGTPETPNCRGFNPTEFQALDFSKLDLTEYYAEIRTKSQGIIEGEVRSRVTATLGP